MRIFASYLETAVFLGLAALALYVPAALLIRRVRGKGLPWHRHAVFFFLVATVGIIFFATIGSSVFRGIPAPMYRLPPNLIPFMWIGDIGRVGAERAVTQWISNVLLFLPLGLLLPLAIRSCRRLPRLLALVGAGVLIIECFQWFIGRSADIDDLIANLLGTALGYGLFVLARRAFQHRPWWDRV